ncbi:hypothetical protein D3C86_1492830 [compost metagenome]
MQWHQVRVIQAADQSSQQGLLHVFPGRRHWQEMRFVRHHQVFVRVQDRLDHRDRLFVRHFSKVVNPQTFLVRQIKGNRCAMPVEDAPTGDPVQPLFTAYGAEVLTQAIEHGLPRTRRQVERTGLGVCCRKR